MKTLTTIFATAAVLAASSAAQAATVTWNEWNPTSIVQSSGSGGSFVAGSATGTMGAVTVTYSGEIGQFDDNYPSWTPGSSYVGGTVGNAPLATDGIFHIVGATGATNIIKFSVAVIDPVIAIWSLGQGGAQASFVFASPFTVEAGGPSAEYGGGPLGGVSPTTTGNEANGVIQFHGTFSSLTFTNPQPENWYGFAVGVEGVSGGVPEPASWALMILGFGGVGAAARNRRRAAALTA